jgi:hypothetical protein
MVSVGYKSDKWDFVDEALGESQRSDNWLLTFLLTSNSERRAICTSLRDL